MYLQQHMNYEVIGSIGYHQVGQTDETLKRLVENSLILNIILEPPFTIPDFLKPFVKLHIKTFMHDAGSYDELVLTYDEQIICSWEDSHDEIENYQAAQFYFWIDEMQSWNWDDPKNLERCEEIFMNRMSRPQF